MSGFITLHRDIFHHPLLKNPERFRAWVWLVANACWKDTDYDLRGTTVTLTRGQICVSRKQLSAQFGWSESAVTRFLTRLKTEQMIEHKTGQKKTIITICNYCKYQDVIKQPEHKTEHKTEHKPNTNRTIKEPLNHKTNSNKPKGSLETRARDNPFPKPDFINESVWQDFLTNRKKKKTPNTATAYKKLISDLERWQGITGWTMEDILVRCTAKGWAAIYEPRDENEKQQRDNIQTGSAGRDKRSGLAKAIDGHLGAENPFI